MMAHTPDIPPLLEGHAALVRQMTGAQVSEPFPLHCEPFRGVSRDEQGCNWKPAPRKAWYWRAWDWFVFGAGLVRRPEVQP